MVKQEVPVPRLNGYRLDDLERTLARTGHALKALHKGRLLLSGGTGFIGQWLLAALVHANNHHGLEVTIDVVTRNPATFSARCPELARATGVHLIGSDIRSFIVSDRCYTHAIHGATDTSVEADKNPFELSDVIVGGTRNVLEQARLAGCVQFLFLSSGAVYGGQGDHMLIAEEDRLACDTLDRRSTYGESKRYAEMLCALYSSQFRMSAKVARCFAFVGPGLPLGQHFAIGNFIRDAVAGQTIVLTGDGTPERSYLYAGDLVAWLLRALVLGQAGRAYHIGSDQAMTLAELARNVSQLIGTGSGVEIRGMPTANGFRSRYIPSVERARKELGCEIWTPLPEAILMTAEWARLSSEQVL